MRILEDYNEVEDTLEDPRFGTIKLFINKYIKTNSIVKKSIQFKSQQQFKISKIQIEDRLYLDHPNILKILEIDFDDKNLISSIFFDYPEKTLDTKNIKIEEAKKMFIDILKAIIYLKSQKMAHGDIRPNFIFFDKIEQKYVLIDRMKSEKTFLECQRENIDNFQCLYLAPYVFDNLVIDNFETKFKIYKNDVFSLGLIFLEILEGKEVIQEFYDFENYFFNRVKFKSVIKEISERIYDDEISKLIFILIDDVFLFEEKDILSLEKILNKILKKKEDLKETKKKFYNPFEFLDLNKSEFEKVENEIDNFKSNIKIKKKRSLFSSLKIIKVNKNMKINTDAKKMNMLMMTQDKDLLENIKTNKIELKNDQKDNIKNGNKYLKLNIFESKIKFPLKINNLIEHNNLNIIDLKKGIYFNNANIEINKKRIQEKQKNNEIKNINSLEERFSNNNNEKNNQIFDYFKNFEEEIENEIKIKTLEQVILENDNINELEIYKSERKVKKNQFKFSTLKDALKIADINSGMNSPRLKKNRTKNSQLKTVNIFNYKKRNISPLITKKNIIFDERSKSCQKIDNINLEKKFIEDLNFEILSYPMIQDISFNFEMKKINKINLKEPIISNIDFPKNTLKNIFEIIKKNNVKNPFETNPNKKNLYISNTWSMVAQKSEVNLLLNTNFKNSLSNQSLFEKKTKTEKKNKFLLYNEKRKNKRDVKKNCFFKKEINNINEILSNKSKDNCYYKNYEEKNDKNFLSLMNSVEKQKIERISHTSTSTWEKSNFPPVLKSNKKMDENTIMNLKEKKKIFDYKKFISEQNITVFNKKKKNF